ncbi:hypothetical protein L6452_21582 [Arctium lappa]|uniref:Uncharacterized protein n=1 Tax=Arctium lappa TaxID=4217 RepID=A0ACB9AY90_ARCLA|nr:hypothetical protein L6452_21582 [Arctium lappa]
MENGFKVRISKMFQSSFNSCRTKTNSDVADHPFFFPENRHHRQLIDLFSPKPQPFSKPKHHLQNHPKPIISRPKISDKNTLFLAPTLAKKPHSLPPPPFYEKTPKKTKKKKPHHRKTTKSQDFSSVTDNYYYDCCSSDEEDESDDETNLFSSRSLSSDSSVSFRKKNARKLRQKESKKPAAVAGGGGGGCKDRKATDVIPLNGKVGKFVKDSVAVVKKSNDPHEDFRVSMLEMIVERQIFGGEDLENLLKCFISLNSEEHHGVILEVFTEIWETLFSEWF